MKTVEIILNGRPYKVACETGQEPRIQQLADLVNEKLTSLVSSMGSIAEPQLMVMGSLLLADEILDLREKQQKDHLSTPQFAHHMNELAQRIESIAGRLERL